MRIQGSRAVQIVLPREHIRKLVAAISLVSVDEEVLLQPELATICILGSFVQCTWCCSAHARDSIAVLHQVIRVL